MNLLQKAALWAAQKAIGSSLQLTYMPGQIVWPDDNKDAYINLGYNELPNVYSIISLIIQKSKMVPFNVYRVGNSQKYMKYKAMIKTAQTPKDYARAIAMRTKALELVEGTDLEEILVRPNDFQSMEDINEALDGYKLLTGNSYLWAWTAGVGIEADKPVQLHVAPSTIVSAVTGDATNPVRAWELQYLDGEIPAQDMGHFKSWKPLTSNLNPANTIYGQSPLMSCRRLLAKYKAADIAQGTFFKNMGPAGMLTGDGNGNDNFGETEATSLKDKFRQVYQGPYKAGEWIITAAQLKWTQIGSSAVDLNIIEGKEEILGELCNVYHVPIGLFTKVNSTENNMVQSRKMLITDAVIPLVEDRKNVLNRWLAPKFDENLVIEYDYTIFTEIRQELETLVKTAREMYWISLNEKRELTDYDAHPDPEMDKIYVPANLMPLEKINQDPFTIDENLLPDSVEQTEGDGVKMWKSAIVDLTKDPRYDPNAKDGEVGYYNEKDGTLIIELID